MEQKSLYGDLDGILYTKEALSQAVRGLGEAISRDYAGREPLLVCTLRGAVVFFSDLLREISLPVSIDFVAASSYAGTESTGKVNIVTRMREDIRGRDVLLVEDIIDTGRTLYYLRQNMLEEQPASVRIATLLDKPSRRKVPLTPDYSCFTIPDAFVVGYGLDYNEKYRNLPEIGILSPRIYQAK